MYLTFKHKDWEPSKVGNMGYGERKVTRVFMQQQIEEDNKKASEGGM